MTAQTNPTPARKAAATRQRNRERKNHEIARRARARRAYLVLLLCPNATATLDDARAAGYCHAGIEAFQRRHGLGDVVPLRTLLTTGNPRAADLARRVAGTASR